MKKIIIYGIGEYGNRLLNILAADERVKANLSKFKIIAFTDKRADEGVEDFRGYPVIQRKELIKQEFDYIIISSEKYYSEIETELEQEFSISRNKIIRSTEILDYPYYCNICCKYADVFYPAGNHAAIFNEKRITGGGERKYAECPHCGSLDRNRWVWYVLEHDTAIMYEACCVLHIAPEAGISTRIRENHQIEYITGDLYENNVDVKMSLTNMPFADQTFDYIICNHVMEHISDEKSAFSEMKRCLKKNGKLVMSFPICWDENTYEKPESHSAEERLLFYGQEDHVRLYGKDIVERLEKYGLTAECFKVCEQLEHDMVQKYSLIPDDTVFICQVN